MTLGVDQRFVAGDNLSLATPSQGDSTFSATTLQFDLSKITSTDRLDFSFGGSLRAGDVPTDVATGFVNPNIGLDYSRIGANAMFSFSVEFEETDVSFDRSLSDYEDGDGRIVLPTDFGDFGDTGTRQAYGFDTSFETGLNDPFGFAFDANYSSTTYQDSTSSDFEDFGVGASAVFRPGQITSLYLDYDYRRFIEDSASDLDSRTNSISLRGVRSLSEVTELTASFGFSDVETEEFGVTSSESNPIASIGLAREMVNGSSNVLLDVTNSRFGRRVTLVFSRDMELPLDSLSYTLGVTNGEDFGSNVIGSLGWRRDLVTGSIFAEFNRDITTNDDDEERLGTTISLGYEHVFTELSSVLLNARYADTSFDNASSDVSEGELSATYRRTLTRDWNLDTGISYRVRDEQSLDSVDSTSVFLSLNRNFDWLR